MTKLSETSQRAIDTFLTQVRRDRITMLRAKHWSDTPATFARVYPSTYAASCK